MKKIDSVFFLYLLLTTCLLLASWNASNNSKELFLVRVIIVFAVIGLIFINSKIQNPIVSFIRSTYPLILSGYFYAENVFFNKLIFDNIDSFLFKLESSLFGMQPSIEFSKSISEKWFSEFMYLGYFSFYLLIIGFALYIYFLNKEYFNKALFILCSSLYIFYLIFSFIPSAGPQFYFTSPESILPDAYIFDKIMHFIQRVAEQPTGAFPSSHVGISIIILILSKKNAPRFFKFILPITIVLILSTVYIKAHYVVDVIGGMLIAPIILYLSNCLYHLSFWNSKESISKYDDTPT